MIILPLFIGYSKKRMIRARIQSENLRKSGRWRNHPVWHETCIGISQLLRYPLILKDQERFSAMKKLLLTLALLAVSTSLCFAQTATTGALTGLVTDPTGAVLPNAVVTITDPGSGAVITVKANAQGRYSSSLLKPGNYTVSASLADFASNTTNVYIALGDTTNADVKMVPAGSKTSVDVNAASIPLLDTQNVALITTFNEQQILDLPAPGGDVTTVAFTLPGVVVNAGGAYGNFSSNGLPGVSNLFVLNGFDNEDPFLNLNNSGSSNLTLGQGELSEVSVVQNGYNSQFGRAAGAILFYTTKTGTNKFHGLVDYYNNTSVMNANSWFGNYAGNPRPHAVSNEWASNLGGPIIKDKVFFFADYEGLRYVLPGFSSYINYPSPQLQTYILSQVPAGALSLYKQAFADYQGAPSYKSAVPVTTGGGPQQDASGALGCGLAANGGLAGTPTGVGTGVFGTNTPCVTSAFATANNINKEWLFTGRGDWVISDKHHVYGRYKMDRGAQPTSTNPISPLFSTISIQPEYEGQFNDTYQISSRMTNSFTLASNWYSAYFGPSNPTASSALYPDYLVSDAGVDGSGTNSTGGLSTLGVPFYLTQGRDVTQYQFEDDWNYLRGKNTWKAGFNFRRDLVSDYDQQIETVYPFVLFYGLPDYAAGQLTPNSPFFGGDSFNQAYSSTLHAHIALYNIGVYVQDELQVLPKLKLTLGARIDRTGNPLCNDNCFSQYQGAFPSSNATLTGAYNAKNGGPIASQNYHPFSSVEPLNFQARAGFNYSPDPKDEIRGGVGMFSDLYPAGFLDGAIQNFPNYNSVSVIASGVYGAGSGAGTVRNNANTANTTILAGYANGGSAVSISNALNAQNVPFSPPPINAYFPGEFKVPAYVEYSLQLQHQFTKSDAVILTYAGNFGYNGILIDPLYNPGSGQYDQGSNSWFLINGYKFGGYPATPTDPRFGRVTALTNNGNSNYNGMQLTYKRSGGGFTGQLSYTYSHSLDDVSNGGSGETFNGYSVAAQLTPNLSTLNLNYSNSDYDVRHNLVGDLVYTESKKFSNFFVNAVAGGWTVGAKTYARTGQPFSVTNGTDLTGFTNLGTTLLPDAATSTFKDTCNNPEGAINGNAKGNTCLNAANFKYGATPQTDFGNVRRNSFRGPHYTDSDLLLTKTLVKMEKIKFDIGANAYNLFNHPNFAAPAAALGLNGFGTITGTVAAPTSPYGSFQGAAVTQRIVQVHGKLTF